MSLYKQLWLAIVFLLTLVLCVSVTLSSVSAKRYLEQQLAIKNSDNATALAISLTQQNADPVLMELTLAAQFDTGFYELIRLTGPDGAVILERRVLRCLFRRRRLTCARGSQPVGHIGDDESDAPMGDDVRRELALVRQQRIDPGLRNLEPARQP